MGTARARTRAASENPHLERSRRLLARHPEARALVGNAPETAAVAVGLVAAQLAIAARVRELPFAWLVLLAYVVGAFVAHGLYRVLHECAHDLVFPSQGGNQALGLVANLPLVFPWAAWQRKVHPLHHACQGVEGWDPELPLPGEAQWVGGSPWRKALWLGLAFAVQPARAARIRAMTFWDAALLSNAALQVAFAGAIAACLGVRALAFLALSSVFATGLHPLGARPILAHVAAVSGRQEATSYYGPLNGLAFNAGYHAEHHDLLRVPWLRLPALKRLAPEFYAGHRFHRAWAGLLIRFVLDPSMGLDCRFGPGHRAARGGREHWNARGARSRSARAAAP